MSFWKRALIILGGFIVVVFLFNSVIMPWYVRHDTLVKVPSVTGLPYTDAQKILEDAGLDTKQGDVRYDPSKPIGTVIEQNPPAEQMVKSGRRIYLVISGGEQVYDVPNLVGRTVREARFSLSQRNLQLIETNTQPSAQYPAGIVLAQVETPGTKVKKGMGISVTVSTGMESGNIKIPDLTGKNVEEAKKLILQNKLAIGKINAQPNTTVPLNSVIDQYPKANSMAKENQKIDLFINKEVKKKVEPLNEENTLEEVKPDKDKDKEKEKPKDTDKEKKPEIKKEDKPSAPPSEKKEDKKKTDKPKDDKKENKDDGGTKF